MRAICRCPPRCRCRAPSAAQRRTEDRSKFRAPDRGPSSLRRSPWLARRSGGAYLGRVRGRGGMAYFVQQLINGLTLGAIYGLIAIGYTMVYGIIGMINFAHGEIYMIGAFVALIAILALISFGLASVPLLLLLVLVGAMAIAGLYGWTIERVIYRPLRGTP